MSEVSNALVGGASTGSGFEALSHLDDGFLGTGLSSSTELSLIVSALIAAYVAIGTVKYYRPGFSVFRTVTGALGLGDR